MRGKKTSEADIIKIFVSYAATGNYAETAKDLDMPVNTVKGIILKNKGKEKFAKLLDKNKEEFAERAKVVRDKFMNLLERRVDRALSKEDELDKLIDEIECDSELDGKIKVNLISKIRTMQIQSASDIARTIGILYDKRALAKGEATENTEIKISVEE